MSLVSIRAALEVALATVLAAAPAVSAAYENVPFTPVSGTPYARVFLLAADPDNPEMGRFTRDHGFLQVDLCYPLGTGPAAATTRAELIRDTFYRGAAFTSGSITVTVEKTPEIMPAVIEEDRYVVRTRVRFYAQYVA